MSYLSPFNHTVKRNLNVCNVRFCPTGSRGVNHQRLFHANLLGVAAPPASSIPSRLAFCPQLGNTFFEFQVVHLPGSFFYPHVERPFSWHVHHLPSGSKSVGDQVPVVRRSTINSLKSDIGIFRPLAASLAFSSQANNSLLSSWLENISMSLSMIFAAGNSAIICPTILRIS